VAGERFSCSDPPGIVAWLTRFRPFQLMVEATAQLDSNKTVRQAAQALGPAGKRQYRLQSPKAHAGTDANRGNACGESNGNHRRRWRCHVMRGADTMRGSRWGAM